MKNSNLITGLDIGSKTIKVLVGVKEEGGLKVKPLSQREVASRGVRRGVVIDSESVSKRISNLLKELSQEVNQEIGKVLVNVGGSHLFTERSQGTVAISRADQKISQSDVDRVIKAARTFSLPPNKEILDIFPKEFTVDKEKGIKEPLGMEGVRLEAKVLAVCVFSPYFKNLTKSVLDSGVEIEDLVPSSLASSEAVLDRRQKELGAALLDIGAWTTDLAVFKEGDLIHLAVFPVGSSHITNDIAIGLQTDIDTAEEIKKEYGSCFQDKRKKDKVEFNEDLTFSSKKLSSIIKARVSEIFDLTKKELKEISEDKLLPGGIVLTGGGSVLPKIVDLTKKELKLPCQRSAPKVAQGNPCFATAWGLVLRGAELREESSFKENVFSRIKKVFKIFVP